MTRQRRWRVYYDGDCGLCQYIVTGLKGLDWVRRCSWIPYQSLSEPPVGLSWGDLQEAVVLETAAGAYMHGYFAFRKLSGALPLLFPMVPVLHIPLVTRIGVRGYRWIADHRHCVAIKTENSGNK